jgi:uncharacterized membrane protein YkoI
MGRTVERGEAERQLKFMHGNLTVATQHTNALGLAVVISARSTVLIVLCAAAATTGAALVSASASSTHPATASRVMPPPDGMSMDQAVRMVEERYHARVVKAETEQDEGHTVYVLRLLNDAGKVWTVRVDPLNGAVQQ